MRTAVVTGSASGLGAAIAARLVDEGWRVIGVDLRGADIEADLASAAGRTTMVAAVTELLGGATSDEVALDGLVACAGLGPHIADHGLIVSVNTFGMLATLDGLYPLLQRGESPAAVAIASNSMGIIPPDEALYAACLAGDEVAARAAAEAIDGSTVYGTSKRAVAVGMRQRAGAWGEAGVRLNAVAPGPVETPLLQATIDDPELGPLVDALPIPLGRRAQPAEIAGSVAFLLGPDAALVHGSILWADGGTDALLRPDAV
jgi:NAD(P)-dependent dehydrogenase (short-subunit alcohol dehydrogenase family)